jgi:2-oxo-4-hydroxy-4-carboxy-5-ureidoimidazoline decarboxylase
MPVDTDPPRPVTLAELNQLARADFTEVLAGVYEHSPWIAAAAWDRRPFADSAALAGALANVVESATPEAVTALLNAHPELAGADMRARLLTAASSGEQAGAGLTTLDEAETARFDALNRAYRARFGFPFIIAVKGRTKDEILAGFERRITAAPEAERATALAEVARIARLRLETLITAAVATGRLTTHVLDTAHGRPAQGMRLDLLRADAPAGTWSRVASLVTNDDGRGAGPLLAGPALVPGHYELCFHVGAYFRSLGVALPEPAFLDRVPIRFGIADPAGHYHVPLLVTPWSYATYRGS